MLWSIIKIVLFVALAAALAIGVSLIVETPGEVRIAFGAREFFVSPMGFLVALALLFLVVWAILKLIGLIFAVGRFLLGDQTAISRYFSRNRERRGFDALTDGMIALAAGDAGAARKKSARAEKLLNRPEITRLVGAQAAELGGDQPRATGYYKAMLADDRTRFVAIKGLMDQKLAEGDRETALELARRAFALRPDNRGILRTLFELQTQQEDWAGARETLNASTHAKLLPRDVGTRRDAVLSLADARKAIAAGDTERGQEAALQANKLAPTLIPAAALAAEVRAGRGSKRPAQKLLATAWASNPHPDLAQAFAGIEPGETPRERSTRFETLIRANPDHSESRLLAAELALADEDFPGARKALGDLASREPTTRSLAIMAAIERGQGAPEAVVRGYLAKALGASRGPQWVCGKCNQVHSTWTPVCDQCGAFDTLAWTTPPHAEESGLAQSAMLPLIVGRIEDHPGESGPDEPVEEAELAESEARTG